MVVLLRKSLIVIIGTAFAYDPRSQGMFAYLLIFGFFILQASVRPFVNSWMNRFELISLAVSCCTFVFGLLTLDAGANGQVYTHTLSHTHSVCADVCMIICIIYTNPNNPITGAPCRQCTCSDGECAVLRGDAVLHAPPRPVRRTQQRRNHCGQQAQACLVLPTDLFLARPAQPLLPKLQK